MSIVNYVSSVLISTHEFKVGDMVRRRRWSDTLSDWDDAGEPPYVVIDVIRIDENHGGKSMLRNDLKLMDYRGKISLYPSIIFSPV
jgi:hypothetical protein